MVKIRTAANPEAFLQACTMVRIAVVISGTLVGQSENWEDSLVPRFAVFLPPIRPETQRSFGCAFPGE
jgi:hypothetical protein